MTSKIAEDGGKMQTTITVSWELLVYYQTTDTLITLKLDWVYPTLSGPALAFQGERCTLYYTKSSGEVRGVIRPLPHLESASCSQVRNRSLKSCTQSRMWWPDHRQNRGWMFQPIGRPAIHSCSLEPHGPFLTGSKFLMSYIWNRWIQIVCVSKSWALLLLCGWGLFLWDSSECFWAWPLNSPWQREDGQALATSGCWPPQRGCISPRGKARNFLETRNTGSVTFFFCPFLMCMTCAEGD